VGKHELNLAALRFARTSCSITGADKSIGLTPALAAEGCISQFRRSLANPCKKTHVEIR
jgi:hypothetical protein